MASLASVLRTVALAALLLGLLPALTQRGHSELLVDASPLSDPVVGGDPLVQPACSKRILRLTKTVTTHVTTTLERPTGLAGLVHRVKQALFADNELDPVAAGGSGNATLLSEPEPIGASVHELNETQIPSETSPIRLARLLKREEAPKPSPMRLGKRWWTCTITVTADAATTSVTTVTMERTSIVVATETVSETSTSTVTLTVTTASATATPGLNFFCYPPSQITANLRFASLNSANKRALQVRDFEPKNAMEGIAVMIELPGFNQSISAKGAAKLKAASSNNNNNGLAAANNKNNKVVKTTKKKKRTTKRGGPLPTSNAWVLSAPFINAARPVWLRLNKLAASSRVNKQVFVKKGPWGKPKVFNLLWRKSGLRGFEQRLNISILAHLKDSTWSGKSGILDSWKPPKAKAPQKTTKRKTTKKAAVKTVGKANGKVVKVPTTTRKAGVRAILPTSEALLESADLSLGAIEPEAVAGGSSGILRTRAEQRLYARELAERTASRLGLDPDLVDEWNSRVLERRQLAVTEQCTTIDDSLCAVAFDLCGTGLGAVSACFVPDAALPADPIIQTITVNTTVTATTTTTETAPAVTASICA